ncbi:hypothetical protein [Falsiroseomonas oryzae]|uniref:hypothetical protein n=1 Tax=Falsiroseomonas oryzae TaxID=2766473 RepID=UPI0022EAD7A0|nr:hypothetical protein [Roseomonas sp. MO-31]
MRLPSLGVLAFAALAGHGALATECPGEGRWDQRSYRNARFAFGFDYPSFFVLDPGSVPPGGDSARFWTVDRRATAVVNAAENAPGRSLRDIMQDAEGDVVQNAGGEITYRRMRDNWFVISGYMVGRIFYRRTLLTRQDTVATLWLEFPREMRPCLDGAVTLMSLSFRER